MHDILPWSYPHLAYQGMRICSCPHNNNINFSLTTGQFHLILKESVISPLLKKSTLDKDKLSNYRPISDQNNRTHC